MHFSFLCSIDLQKKTSFLQNCRRRYPDTPKRGNVTILAGARPLRVFHRGTRLIKLNNIHVVIIIFSLFENFEFLNYFGSVCEKLNGKKKCLTFKHSDYEHILCICFAIKNLEFLF